MPLEITLLCFHDVTLKRVINMQNETACPHNNHKFIFLLRPPKSNTIIIISKEQRMERHVGVTVGRQ